MTRYILQSLNVLNGLLALAVAATVTFAVLPSLNPVAGISLPTVTETATASGEIAAPSRNLPAVDYAVISDKNLFHQERKIPPEKQPEKAVPKPELFLYGTLIADDASYAFIEDKKAPYSTPGRAERQVTLKKGDHFNGYLLSEIEANRIVLVKGEEKIVVMLEDRAKKRAGDVPAGPGTGRMAAGGLSPSPPVAPSAPQVMPSSPPMAVSPGSGIAGPQTRPSSHPSLSPSPQMMPPSAQEAPAMKPGIGASGTWPPTKSSIEQTQQKIQEGREMRAGQIQRGQ